MIDNYYSFVRIVEKKEEMPKLKSNIIYSKNNTLLSVFRNRGIYLILLPGIIWYIIFHYMPMYGITLAFKDYSYRAGISGSPWVGLENFRFMLRDIQFWRALNNTLIISFGKVIFSFPVPIFLALLLNELRSKSYKKIIQSMIYLPHFLSWIIVGGIIFNMLSISSGFVNNVIVDVFHRDPILFLGNEKTFLPLVFISTIWKDSGWGTIIFLAAIAGINPELYESAILDGAGKLKQVIHITLPTIRATISILLLFRIGSVMNAGFDQIFNLYSPAVYKVGDIIDTFVYRSGIEGFAVENSTAVGLFKSVVNCALLLTANKVVKWLGEEGIF